MSKLWILVGLLLAQPTKAQDSFPSEIDEMFALASEQVGVPDRLLRAICWVESSHRADAYNHGDGTGINHAFGICQVLHSTAREYGFNDPKCYQTFGENNHRTYGDCKLFGLYTSIFYGALYLKSKLAQYNGDWALAAAAYNAGTVRFCRNGRVTRAKDKSTIWPCEKGRILNHRYVDLVFKALEENR
jgi:soluble lytic murein transglycosylase-like protein